ncbi:MAG: hypothetical protein PVI57_03295 [Gemmatimonadota bacterium]|jgi:hypothetical protein
MAQVTDGSEPSAPPTVGDLVGSALQAELEEDLPPEEAEAWVGAIRAALEEALPPGTGGGSVGHVVAMLREALGVPIPEVLVSAWRRYEPFRKYVDPRAYPPGVEAEVPLATHTARSLLEPEVEVVVQGRTLARLRFETEVALTLDGAMLRVRDGRFRSVRLGDCTVAGEVKFRGHTLARTEPHRESLPGELSFGDRGVPIDPFGEDPYAALAAPDGETPAQDA